MAAFPARDHPAKCPVVRAFGVASSLRRETHLQNWTHCHALSYRDLEEMMQERGEAGHDSIINRWFLKSAPELDKRIRSHLSPTNDSWRVDKTSRHSACWGHQEAVPERLTL
ncbi:MAG: IS6 family transposase [Pantanalinema sp. GBBB05]|nr:IS6 family transposase [Pantanalinema sp. GBBB05]